jgi:hypothetical protein
MGHFSTIKQLVIETCIADGAFPSHERLMSLVFQHFPSSKWNKDHYAWYKSQIKRGLIVVPGLGTVGTSGDDQAETSDEEIEQAFEASVSLERDLHAYLAGRLGELEAGLVLEPNGVEHQTEAGRIDLLARDSSGRLVVVELKAGKAKDAALGQLLGYMGCMAERESSVRGILVASDFENRVKLAARALPNVKLLRYQLLFSFEPCVAAT